MRPVSERFARALRSSHQLATLAEVMRGGEVLLELPIDDGTVTLDQTAATRGRCDVTLTDPGLPRLVPDTATAPLAPYGNELRLSRGIAYPDGTRELVRLGVFRIEDVDDDDQGSDLTIRVSGLDRSARIADARFEAPYPVAEGSPCALAIRNVLIWCWPGVPISPSWPADVAGNTTPALLAEEGADPWAFAQQMATAFGHELYFDGNGEACLTPTSSLSTGAPVVELDEGDDGVLLQASRKWSRAGAFNRVIATGENPAAEAAPPRGIATDENPLSPTYYHGPFGRVPRFYSSPFIATDEQATDAAAAMLARELGTTQQVTFGSVVLPHLEPGDVARVRRPRAGIDENHVIDSLTIPLSAGGTTTGSTRALQVT